MLKLLDGFEIQVGLSLIIFSLNFTRNEVCNKRATLSRLDDSAALVPRACKFELVRQMSRVLMLILAIKGFLLIYIFNVYIFVGRVRRVKVSGRVQVVNAEAAAVFMDEVRPSIGVALIFSEADPVLTVFQHMQRLIILDQRVSLILGRGVLSQILAAVELVPDLLHQLLDLVLEFVLFVLPEGFGIVELGLGVVECQFEVVSLIPDLLVPLVELIQFLLQHILIALRLNQLLDEHILFLLGLRHFLLDGFEVEFFCQELLL